MTTLTLIISGLLIAYISYRIGKHIYQKRRKAFIDGLHKGQSIHYFDSSGVLRQAVISHVFRGTEKVHTVDNHNIKFTNILTE